MTTETREPSPCRCESVRIRPPAADSNRTLVGVVVECPDCGRKLLARNPETARRLRAALGR